MTIRLVAVVLVAASLVACVAQTASRNTSSGLTIYAAASLARPLEAVRTAYFAAPPRVAISISTDSSTALRTKIEQGAPADLFLSADEANPQRLVDQRIGLGPPTRFAGNSLAIVVPRVAGAPGGMDVRTPADLARPGVKIVAAGLAVPISAYATELIDRLSDLPGYPADFATAYEANVISREDNVSAVLAKVELGEGDAGVVYRTDALGADRVTALEIPPAAVVTATYAGTVVAASPQRMAASDFLAWLAGPDGQAVLGRFGFVAVP